MLTPLPPRHARPAPRRTHTFAVLLVLLRSPHADVMSTGEGSALAGRWYDLVVKCLIKLTKALPATLEVRALSQFGC